MNKLTQEQYTFFQKAFDQFNKNLFDNKLPQVLITLQRKKGACGYYSQGVFSGRHNDVCVDEIALNPDAIDGYEDVELWATLLHEMVHEWQAHFGKVSRNGYHNSEWANKMEEVGLIPSSTGKEGGKRTGQNMSDYPKPDGLFLKEVEILRDKGVKMNWQTITPPLSLLKDLENKVIDLVLALDSSDDLLESNGIDREDLEKSLALASQELTEEKQRIAKKESKSKYECSGCGLVVRGKLNLNLKCEDCDMSLKVV